MAVLDQPMMSITVRSGGTVSLTTRAARFSARGLWRSDDAGLPTVSVVAASWPTASTVDSYPRFQMHSRCLRASEPSQRQPQNYVRHKVESQPEQCRQLLLVELERLHEQQVEQGRPAQPDDTGDPAGNKPDCSEHNQGAVSDCAN